MAIVIEHILGPTDRGVRARVRHEDAQLEVEIAAPAEKLRLEQDLIIELSFAAVDRWRLVHPPDAVPHGLTPVSGDSGLIQFVGTVHNVIEVEDGPDLIDVYSSCGPEFLVFDAEDFVGTPPREGDTVELVVRGLCCYPSRT